MAKQLWTRNEAIMAFNLYCKVPFHSINSNHKDVIALSAIINRTPSAIAWKLANFFSLDPNAKSKGLSGASNCSKLDKDIFNEFNNNWEDLAFESEKLYNQYFNKNNNTEDLDLISKIGIDIDSNSKTRMNQSFFRKTILSSYNNKCCITGLNNPKLLIASHIKPWSIDSENRTNPQNGLCLNSLHDKAFDKGLIGVDKNYRIKISAKITEYLPNEAIEENFVKYLEKEIILPDKFLPNIDFLDWHLLNIFLK
jgi:putative restriction endonuclease